MKLRYKLVAYVATWLIALFCVDFSVGLWPLAYMFPLGLYAFFFPAHRQSAGWTILILTVALYVTHAIYYFRARTLRGTLIWLAVLVILLTCNAAGCHQMIHAH